MKQLHHLCIQTDEYEASVKFYTEILGFTLMKESAGFHGRDYNTWLKLDDLWIELQTGKAGEHLLDCQSSTKGLAHFSFVVDDVVAEYNRLKRMSFDRFKTKNGQAVYEVEKGRLLKLVAPEGTIVELRENSEI